MHPLINLWSYLGVEAPVRCTWKICIWKINANIQCRVPSFIAKKPNLYLPHLDKIKTPTTERQSDANDATTIMNAKAWLGRFRTFWVFFKNLSINGARTAAPATLSGLVTLLPVHISITICKTGRQWMDQTSRVQFCTTQSGPKNRLMYDSAGKAPSTSCTITESPCLSCREIAHAHPMHTG